MRALADGLLQQALGRRYGEAAWADLLEAARVPDGDDLPSDALAGWYGREAVKLAAAAHPRLFSARGSARAFVRALGDPGASGLLVSETGAGSLVDVLPSPDGDLLVALRPPAGPCAFLEGVVIGAAEAYGERVAVRRLKCLRHGDNRCLLSVAFGVAVSSSRRPEPASAGRTVA